MDLFAFSQRLEPGAGLENAGEGAFVGFDGIFAHSPEEQEGFLGGLLCGEGSDHDVVRRGIGLLDGAKDGEGVGDASGEGEGGGFQEVFGDLGVEEEAAFDEMGVDLGEISYRFALLEEKCSGVVGKF